MLTYPVAQVDTHELFCKEYAVEQIKHKLEPRQLKQFDEQFLQVFP